MATEGNGGDADMFQREKDKCVRPEARLGFCQISVVFCCCLVFPTLAFLAS